MYGCLTWECLRDERTCGNCLLWIPFGLAATGNCILSIVALLQVTRVSRKFLAPWLISDGVVGSFLEEPWRRRRLSLPAAPDNTSPQSFRRYPDNYISVTQPAFFTRSALLRVFPTHTANRCFPVLQHLADKKEALSDLEHTRPHPQ